MRTHRTAGRASSGAHCRTPRLPTSSFSGAQAASKSYSHPEGVKMATHRSSKKSDQSESMIEADIANGEAPDTIQEDATESRGAMSELLRTPQASGRPGRTSITIRPPDAPSVP